MYVKADAQIVKYLFFAQRDVPKRLLKKHVGKSTLLHLSVLILLKTRNNWL